VIELCVRPATRERQDAPGCARRQNRAAVRAVAVLPFRADQIATDEGEKESLIAV